MKPAQSMAKASMKKMAGERSSAPSASLVEAVNRPDAGAMMSKKGKLAPSLVACCNKKYK